MTDRLRGTPWLASLIVLAGTLGALAACDRNAESRAPATVASPSAVVIGTAPAAPQSETAQTTPVEPAGKELEKTDEREKMPLAGQPNDHSNLAPNASQRAGAVDAQLTPERKQP